MSLIVVGVAWVDDADARVGDPLLRNHPRQCLCKTKPQRMITCDGETGSNQTGHIVNGDRAVRNATVRCRDLDQRLEPQHAARPVAHDSHTGLPGEG